MGDCTRSHDVVAADSLVLIDYNKRATDTACLIDKARFLSQSSRLGSPELNLSKRWALVSGSGVLSCRLTPWSLARAPARP